MSTNGGPKKGWKITKDRKTEKNQTERQKDIKSRQKDKKHKKADGKIEILLKPPNLNLLRSPSWLRFSETKEECAPVSRPWLAPPLKM